MNKYYVYNKDRGKPKYPHSSYAEALKEAERLAEKEGVFFEVLKVVAKVEIEKRLRVKEFLKEVE
jgi:hypothetical protein